MSAKKCDGCQFWMQTSENPIMGDCRRHAPQAIAVSPLSNTGSVDAVWPRTRPDEWCGEFDPRAESS